MNMIKHYVSQFKAISKKTVSLTKKYGFKIRVTILRTLKAKTQLLYIYDNLHGNMGILFY